MDRKFFNQTPSRRAVLRGMGALAAAGAFEVVTNQSGLSIIERAFSGPLLLADLSPREIKQRIARNFAEIVRKHPDFKEFAQDHLEKIAGFGAVDASAAELITHEGFDAVEASADEKITRPGYYIRTTKGLMGGGSDKVSVRDAYNSFQELIVVPGITIGAIWATTPDGQFTGWIAPPAPDFVNNSPASLKQLGVGDGVLLVVIEGEKPTDSEPKYVFGEAVSDSDKQQIRDAVAMSSKEVSKAGVSVNNLTVYVDPDKNFLIDKYFNVFNIPLNRRDNIRTSLSTATAFSSGSPNINQDVFGIFVVTSSPGWTIASPIIGGPVKEGHYFTMAHEYFLNVISKVKGDTKPFPYWLLEGSSHYFAGKVISENGLYSYGLLRDGHVAEASHMTEFLSSMETAAGFFNAGTPYADEYSLAFLGVEFATRGLQVFGTQLLVDFWTKAGSGLPWRQAFENVFGVSIDKFYNDFEVYRKNGFK